MDIRVCVDVFPYRSMYHSVYSNELETSSNLNCIYPNCPEMYNRFVYLPGKVKSKAIAEKNKRIIRYVPFLNQRCHISRIIFKDFILKSLFLTHIYQIRRSFQHNC